MKKLLLTTALLGASASMAMADVSLSGSGRFGVVSEDDNDATTSDTVVSLRFRLNIDASKETDSGATFGGRVRLQSRIGDYTNFSDDPDATLNGQTGATLSAAYLYVEYEGLRVEVGNSNTAYDSAALLYASEIGFIGSSGGNSRTDIFSFSSGPYGQGYNNRVGIYASYSVSGFTGQISYVDPDQVNDVSPLDTPLVDDEEELSIALAYETDQFTVSAAAVMDGGGVLDNDEYFLGGQYNVNDDIKVGLNYISNDDEVAFGDTVVLYGSYAFGATTVSAYIANNDASSNVEDTTYGIGASYDLGGATLDGSIQRKNNDNDEAYADLGVNFSF